MSQPLFDSVVNAVRFVPTSFTFCVVLYFSGELEVRKAVCSGDARNAHRGAQSTRVSEWQVHCLF